MRDAQPALFASTTVDTTLTPTALRTTGVSLPLSGGLRLHVALTRDQDGAPVEVLIGKGYPDHSLLHVFGRALCLPADALPGLRRALDELGG